jgi:hypothetical protein
LIEASNDVDEEVALAAIVRRHHRARARQTSPADRPALMTKKLLAAAASGEERCAASSPATRSLASARAVLPLLDKGGRVDRRLSAQGRRHAFVALERAPRAAVLAD